MPLLASIFFSDDEGPQSPTHLGECLSGSWSHVNSGCCPTLAQRIEDVEQRLWLLEHAEPIDELQEESERLRELFTALEKENCKEEEEGLERRRELDARLEQLETSVAEATMQIEMIERELSLRREHFTTSRHFSEWEFDMVDLMDQLEKAQMARESAEVERAMLQEESESKESPKKQGSEEEFVAALLEHTQQLQGWCAQQNAALSPDDGGASPYKHFDVLRLDLPSLTLASLCSGDPLRRQLSKSDTSCCSPMLELVHGPTRSAMLIAGSPAQRLAAERTVQRLFTLYIYTQKQQRDWEDALAFKLDQLFADVRQLMPRERCVQSKVLQFMRMLREDVSELTQHERGDLVRKINACQEDIARAILDNQAVNLFLLKNAAEASSAHLDALLMAQSSNCLVPNVVCTAYGHWLELQADLLREVIQSSMEERMRRAPSGVRMALHRQIMKGDFPHLEMFKRHSARFLRDLEQGGTLAHAIFVASIHNAGAALELPIYLQSDSLLARLHHVDVLGVPSNAGSGKTILLPALLAAELGSCVVTQPRSALCLRAKTYVQQRFGNGFAEWQTLRHNPSNDKAHLVYITEEAQVAQLVADPGLRSNRFRVIFLDEVHERSKNIDLAVLAVVERLVAAKADGAARDWIPKVILGSATLDPALLEPFRRNGLQTLREIVRVPSPFPVLESEKYVGKHFLSAVIDVFQNKRTSSDEQVLCFVPTRTTGDAAVVAFREATGVVAYALHAMLEQSALDDAIKRGLVFFATNVATTSLTFPKLAHVLDCGKWIAKYVDQGIVQYEEEFAPLSIIQQRKGRCGRVCEGTYYPLYGPEDITSEYPIPRLITQSIVDQEFLVWVTHDCGFIKLEQYWPGSRYRKEFKERTIEATEFLRALGVVDDSDNVTSLGRQMSWLPDLGGVRLLRATVAAFEAGIGQDMLNFCAAYMALPEANRVEVLGQLPGHFYDPVAGDAGALLNFCRETIQAHSEGPHQFIEFKQKVPPALRDVVNATLYHVRRIRNALFEKLDNTSDAVIRDFLDKATGTRPEASEELARCLLTGFFDHASRCMANFQGPQEAQLLLYKTTGMKWEGNSWRIGEIHPMSLVHTQKESNAKAVDWVFSLHLNQNSGPLMQLQTVSMGIVVPFKPEWLTHTTSISIGIHADEDIISYEPPATVSCHITSAEKVEKDPDSESEGLPSDLFSFEMEGPGGTLGIAVQNALESLLEVQVFYVEPRWHVDDDVYASKIRQLQSNLHIFDQWRWQWQKQRQVLITIEPRSDHDQPEKWDVPKVSWRARRCHSTAIQANLEAFLWGLTSCTQLHTYFPPHDDEWDPYTGLQLHAPRFIPPRFAEVRERIRRVTDSQRSPHELWAAVNGPDASRVSRMEAVAWVAVTKFDVCLGSGFVRDWVVGGYQETPNDGSAPSTWRQISDRKSYNRPLLDNRLVPRSLDVQASTEMYLNLHAFLSEVSDLGLEITSVHDDPRLTVVLFDASIDSKFGPFTIEFAMPHLVSCHTEVDLDVNNLYVAKDATQALGLRVPAPFLSVPKTMEHIQQRRFIVCKPLDDELQERIQKMVARGWTHDTTGDQLYVPPSPGSVTSLHPSFSSHLLPRADTFKCIADWG